MLKVVRLLIVSTLTISLLYALNTKFGKVPPVGKFLNPFEGFWQNAESKELPEEIELNLSNEKLQGDLEIFIDERLVPHIFAKNDYDLYFAQGYVTAYFRLWQMEFQTQAASGRISEILGAGENDQYLKYDLYQRRIGMLYAAEKSLDTMMQNETMKTILEAYTDGVNAYINQLSPKDYPIEYKILDYSPEEWTPLKCALLLKYMAYDLSASGNDWAMTNILHQKGKEVVKELFPNYPKRHEPIIPSTVEWDFRASKNPKVPKNVAVAPDTTQENINEQDNDRDGIGSNNWAISGEKTASGYPILANDPHLTLNLPSIWFEIQLITPKTNVYGVSLPGSPCVIIGFNKEISWGVTNVGSDVMDWYKIKFKDENLAEYWHNEEWKNTSQRVEEINIRGQETFTDTMFFTHQGPVVMKPNEEIFSFFSNPAPAGYALRWIAHEPALELMTFYKMNRARSYRDYKKALTYYASPAQNFIFADMHGDIAITPNGKFPLKWKGQGKFLLDGTDARHDWQDWIPQEHNPHIKNPPRGFVSSANQFSTDTLYPYYMGWDFATYERGKRINEELAKMQQASYKDFIKLQNDNMNINARDLLPTMLSYLKKNELKNEYLQAYNLLEKWNHQASFEEIAPIIFKTWWNNMMRATWEDDFVGEKMIYPESDITGDLILLYDSLPSVWFDDKRTPEFDSLPKILENSFIATIDTLTKKYGKIGEPWKWKNTKKTNILHLGFIPGFGVLNIPTNGDKRIVNATGRRTGPSWKMVVALGKSVKAYGIYPGGQSGNPGSFYYDNMIETWRKGDLEQLFFMWRSSDYEEKMLMRIVIKKDDS